MNLGHVLKSSIAAPVILALIAAAVPNNPAAALPPKWGPKWSPKPFKPFPKPIIELKPKPLVKPYLKPIVKPILKAKVHVVRAPGVRVVVPVYRAGVITRRVARSVVVSEVDDLPVVPARQIADVEAYRVLSVDENYLVTALIDGQPTPVRMLGVEPPLVAASENESGTLPEEAIRFGRDLLINEFVYLVHDPGLQQRDAEGNLVAYLYRVRDKLLVNLELIRAGYGLAAEDYAFEHQELFLAYQQKAQADGKGIWDMLVDAER